MVRIHGSFFISFIRTTISGKRIIRLTQQCWICGKISDKLSMSNDRNQNQVREVFHTSTMKSFVVWTTSPKSIFSWVIFIRILPQFHCFQSITSFSFNLITFLSGLFAVLTWNYLLSYFLTTLTLNAMSIGYCVYGLHWYQMSCNEQIMVQMIIRRSQKPFELKGLGLFACSLETYLKVIERKKIYHRKRFI